MVWGLQLMAEEAGLKVDILEFNELMQEQRQRSRAAGKSSAGSAIKFEAEATAHLASSGVPRTDDSPKYGTFLAQGACCRQTGEYPPESSPHLTLGAGRTGMTHPSPSWA